LQQFLADLFDPARDPVAVKRPERFQSPQHEEHKRALENVGPGWLPFFIWLPTGV
jgi:hypothetical protein